MEVKMSKNGKLIENWKKHKSYIPQFLKLRQFWRCSTVYLNSSSHTQVSNYLCFQINLKL